MSNEPIRKMASSGEPPAVGPAPDAAAATPQVDLAADAELVLGAIHRIEKAIYDGYATPPMQRLGREIEELAADVAEARLSFALDREYGARATDMEALLHRLETRVAAMQAIATSKLNGTQATAEARDWMNTAQADPVPTVSHVVALLGQTDEWGTSQAAPYVPPAGRPPSLAMLEAMVEALNVAPSAPVAASSGPDVAEDEDDEELAATAEAGEVATESDPPEESAPVVLAAADQLESDTELDGWSDPQATDPPDVLESLSQDSESKEDEPGANEAEENESSEDEPHASGAQASEADVETSAPDDDALDSPVIDTPVIDTPADIEAREGDLLSSFARMEAMPYLPQEIGTAVIFNAAESNEPRESSAAIAETVGSSRHSAIAGSAKIDGGMAVVATVSARPVAFGLSDIPVTEQVDLTADDLTAEDATMAEGVKMAEDADLFEPEASALRFNWPAGATAAHDASHADSSAALQERSLAADPLAPLRHLSRAETLALFS